MHPMRPDTDTPQQYPYSRPCSCPGSRFSFRNYPMAEPPSPLASPGGAIPAGAQQLSPRHSPSMHSLVPEPDCGQGGGYGGAGQAGDGVPMRHPRPLTTAELHLELEELEAEMNRLTRGLSALRAHSASVASTASSNASAIQPDNHTGAGAGEGADYTYPLPPDTASRRRRSSSSISRTSMGAHAGPATFSTGIPLTPATAGIPHSQHSNASPVSNHSAHQAGNIHPQVSTSDMANGLRINTEWVGGLWSQCQKLELEDAKRENERLKERIRELEGMIRGEGEQGDFYYGWRMWGTGV